MASIPHKLVDYSLSLDSMHIIDNNDQEKVGGGEPWYKYNLKSLSR
jgi:hypothetical protein